MRSARARRERDAHAFGGASSPAAARWRRDSDRAPLGTCPCIKIDLDAFWLEVSPAPLAESATEGEFERGEVDPTIACDGAGGGNGGEETELMSGRGLC